MSILRPNSLFTRANLPVFSRCCHWAPRQCNDDTSTPYPLLPDTSDDDWSRYSDKTHAFVDYARALCKAGDGGRGAVHFLSLASKLRAGPDGGDGGHGAHVIFKADPSVSSLAHLTKLAPDRRMLSEEEREAVEKGMIMLFAPNGANGRHNNMNGKNAEHLCIPVPLGTTIRLVSNDDVCSVERQSGAPRVSDRLTVDLLAEGDALVGARGGAGGHGNSFFATDLDVAPRVAELGGQGERRVYDLWLRFIADVGLVGFPNAGKSTLLRAMSRARPKVAAYRFTTLRPIIGVVHFDDYSTLNVADLPGLISGAHENVGLGSAFLRHVERCRCLAFVLDAALPDASPVTQWIELRRELRKYEPRLVDVPSLPLLNKVELAEDTLGSSEFRKRVSDLRAEMGGREYRVSLAGRRADLVPVLRQAVRLCRAVD